MIGVRGHLALLLAAVLAGGIAAAPALAQGAEEESEGDARGTVAQITVYGWLAGATGEITPFAGAPTLEFESAFSEVLEDLDAAFFASGLVRKDRLVFVGDLSYASLSREGLVPPGVPAMGEVSQLAVTMAGGARVVSAQTVTIDLLAGARLWNVESRVDVPLAGVSVSPEETFLDPIIAARFNVQIAPRLSTIAHVDLGGVGIGSEFTYQVVGTVNYRVGRATYLSAGYRHLYLDYEDGGTVFEGSQTGPLIGITQRF